MAVVHIPSQLRELAAGVGQVEIEGATLGEVIAALDRQFPGLADRLVDGQRLAPGLAASIDGHLTARGLLAPVRPDSEIHFLPAIGGG